ncbi:ABC transporter ATP-binding protein [Spiractinospora alimapuensis]|uniref:ABC transporter ATP-binding protein n=1 Tax=Spiractinospora alimapuensis TaxID=2820884 RepID=UPI001F370CA7|nr:ABC transporter ATP-binding protein [Spiractinospora alimapuensis]QVQ50354.1 ABC transporter ATP-binding protein [Spiractinospora alimapuensis]
MDSHVVRMNGVGVRRDGAHLLSDVDWTVDAADRWVVIGPNGAGKTTLLRVAATQLFPTEGTVEVLEERLGAVDVFEVRPRVGFASAAVANEIPGQEKAIDLVMSASYAILGRWREAYDDLDRDRARALLAWFGVEHLAERRFSTLSEGERKRVQVARALMPDPELLLLDEPAAGLDLGGREDLVGRLSVLARDETSPCTVMVTHHLEEIPPGFTHALLLREGRAVAAGPIASVLTASTVSETFGLRLKVEQVDGRWSARAI